MKYRAWVLLTVSTSMAWSMALESMILDQPDFAWLLRFLQLELNFLSPLVTI